MEIVLIKIAYYMTTILEHGGGLENYIIDTVSELQNRGIEADVLTMNDSYTKHITNILTVVTRKKIGGKLNYKISNESIKSRLGKARYLKIDDVKKLRSQLNEYDIVYSKAELLEALFFKFVVGYKNIPPVIFGCHTPAKYEHPKSLLSKLHNLIYGGKIYKYLVGEVAAFHVLNSEEKNFYKKSFPNTPIFMLPNPFNKSKFVATARLNRSRIADSNDKKILWVGRLTEQKGVDDLLLLIDYINSCKLSVSLHIVGDGERRADIIGAVKSNRFVNFYGWKDKKFMASIYSQMDLFVSTSKWEAYPYNLLEARAFCLPIVTYRIPGVLDTMSGYEPVFYAENVKGLLPCISLALDDRTKKIDDNFPDYRLAYDNLYQMFREVNFEHSHN